MDVVEATAFYRSQFARFEKRVAGREPAWLHRLRLAAFSRFTELRFPSTQDEAWRHTDVAPVAEIPFQAAGYRRDARTAEQLAEVTFGAASWSRLVFLNGHFSPELSTLQPLRAGVRVSSLAVALGTDASAVEPYLAHHARYEDRAFVALNTAFMKDGAFVSIPPDTALEAPLHLVFASTADGEATMSHPRNLIVMGPGSQATIAQSYIGVGEGRYFTNAVTELVLGEHATIDHYTLQRESGDAFHIAALDVHQDHTSSFSSHSVALGGALVRNEITAVLDGEGIACNLNGLFMVTGRQHMDIRTMVDHVKPHCTSRQLYKGVLGGHSRAVFTGKILVRPGAQKTDAMQTNKSLLLSEDATLNTTPQLEIFADDVKCQHGATIGQLDPDALFYLRSRGIGEEAARNLMIAVFAREALSRIGHDPIRAYLADVISTWVSAGKPVRETSLL